jgi:2',3'-cyclic-nucleotide 2'-phosphodiesterase (5'-nucleotidase family)
MLTNTVLRPDIFTPGNHEYDFGKPVFLEGAKRHAAMTAL